MSRPAGKKAANPFDSDPDDEFVLKSKRGSSSSTLLENKSYQELKSYAMVEAEKTTQKVNGCLRIAEYIKEDATRTLVTLYRQKGSRSIEAIKQLLRSIRILLSAKHLEILGGWFFKSWKPTQSHHIKGSVLTQGIKIYINGHSGRGQTRWLRTVVRLVTFLFW